MADIVFESDGKARFPTKHHGEVALSKAKWDQICAQPERYYYRLNGEKVAMTLAEPDMVRHHTTIASQFLYYKSFPRFVIAPGVEVSGRAAMIAVAIDTATHRVCTIYPTDKPKIGSMEYRPHA